MGAIARSSANNITTSGVFTADAITNASVTGITVLANAEDGITLISSQTASGSASLSFTTGLDSTYKAYKFVFSNIHPATDSVNFQVNFRDGDAAYDATKTSTSFYAYADEAGTDTALGYDTGKDLAQSTGVQTLLGSLGNGNDESTSGEIILYNPSSTTYVKHYIAKIQYYNASNYTQIYYVAGYCNTTNAIDGVQFSMSSGNIDAGTIYMYGIK